MSKLQIALLVVASAALVPATSAQITLSGTSYTQDFDSIGSGLPTGWSVFNSATLGSLGTATTFSSTATNWSAARVAGEVFRNSSSSNIASSSSSTNQANNSNRALGWRPNLAGEREGAITLQISNTLGFNNFSVSLDIFTFNDVSAVATYDFEYRIGDTGNFTKLGSTYTTGAAFSSATFTADSVALSALNNQADTVYFRVRGTTSTGTGSLDGVAIDNFSLNFTAIPPPSSTVPEPSATAALAGLATLGLVASRRRRRAA